MSRERRIHLIREFLASSPASSQAEIAESLESLGESATQTTISRDLKQLGALKGPNGYSLPSETFGAVASPTRDRLIQDHVLSIQIAGGIVILKTAPGHASMVAAGLDESPPDGCVGTIAGDDTIFVATPSGRAAQELVGMLSEMLVGVSA